jgi:hypothetical protein
MSFLSAVSSFPFSHSQDREQTSIVFGAASRMIQQDAVLSRITNITPSIKRIQHPPSGSTFRAVSHEAYSKHGLSITCLLADEVHAWPTRELWDVLTTSMGKREQPLVIAITTAGVGRTGIAWELYSYAKRVAAGEIEDSTFLPVLLARGLRLAGPRGLGVRQPGPGCIPIARGDADVGQASGAYAGPAGSLPAAVSERVARWRSRAGAGHGDLG